MANFKFFLRSLFLGLILICKSKLVSADGHVNIQVQVLSYDNPLGTSFSGSDFTSQRKCCDSGRNITACSTTDACDSYIFFCIGGVSHGHCIGPHSSSKILSMSNSLSTSYDNIIYSFVWDHWNSGNIDYTFNIMDKDNGGQDLIDNFTSSTALRVDTNYEESVSQVLSFKHFVSLDIGIRIWCQDGYTGSDCSRQCTNMTYKTCSKNNGSTLLPSCSDIGVLRLPELSGSSIPLNYTSAHLKKLLFNFILHEICPEADKVNVTILHFTLNGASEFRATCNNTDVSNLLFTTHIYIRSITDKTSLSRYFPNIQFTQPAVKQIHMRGAHVFMMLNLAEYQDTSSACRNHTCSVEISICLHRNNEGCETTITILSTMHGTSLVICGGHLLDSSTGTNGQYLIGLSTIPVIDVEIKYDGKTKWQVHNQTIQPYTVGSIYKGKPRKMSFSSDHGQSLVLEFTLWCAVGWSGNHCQHSCHSTSNRECNADGHLVCREGYHLSTCVDINECNHNPCKNGGSCHNTPGSFTCQCSTGWTGPTCEMDVDECDLGYCQNASSCTNSPGSFHCRCTRGFRGRTCRDHNECKSPIILCKHGGLCLNQYGSYSCLCIEGFTGRRCDDDIDECAQSICDKNNTVSCGNTVGDYSCNCKNGWTGKTCETDIDECQSKPCYNGTCKNVPGNYTCLCYSEYNGRFCESDLDECLICNKNNTVSCNNTVGDYSCNCKNGWTGKTCETDIDECQSKPCFNGTCKNIPGNYTCSCYSGYDGRNCENDLNECLVIHCANNGTCVNLPYPERYRCDCLEGWDRKSRCRHPTDPCKTFQPCVHGSCTNKYGNYICTCDDGWNGHNCSNDIDECTSSPCKNNGICSNTQGSFTCSCLPGWSGLNCDTGVDVCKPLPYKNNGTFNNCKDKLEEAIYPRCTNSGWNVTLNISMLKEIYPAISSNHIFFGDSSCLGRLKGDLLIFQQGFRECLTSERISGTTILYENDLYYAIYDPINPFIIRQHKWTYTVECDVGRNEATSSHVHHDIEAHHTAVSGHFNISLMFYKDPGYMQQMSGNPLHANVGDQVYVKVVTSASDWSIKMRMHTCYTKPTDAADNLIYYIIKDGCEVDSNTHIISQSTHETRFVFQDFEYSTNREGLNIYCNATFCETQDYSPGCAQSCVLPGTP